ncbi:probable G-protein coupled receptor Mth-like 9 [Drosophila grimshawi]|uniref:GH15472 n=1 Tax=Drosophila grimshawi TaxID=7222 RepID=B4J2B9_DROGR|nr:probable G-protein coupled receptor Mth-like 9 [Drosophila grimshawi]EDV95978.1 GH15472 [Drosophila grimshawi]
MFAMLVWLIIIATTITTISTETTIAKAHGNFPCPYADTVNITDGLRLRDGSYSFAGVLVPAELTAEYNFKVIDGVEYKAARHLRGCVCQIKPCITFCCPPDLVFNAQRWNCTRPNQVRQITHIELSASGNRSVEQVKIMDHFVVRTELGCRNKFVDSNHDSFWQWDLHANGSLQRDDRLWSTDEYCFTPLEHNSAWELAPLNCERFQRGYRVWIYAICCIIAILINIFIMALLSSVNEARRSHFGKLIIYYLFFAICGHSLIVYLTLKNPMNLSHEACRNIGYLAYFFIMLSFVYLANCSLDFLLKFRLIPIKNWWRILWYSLSFVCVIVLRFLVSFAQSSNLPKHLKPGIGEDYCWFDVRLWGILMYYYAPIALLLIFSIGCCLKTYFSIYELPADTQYIQGTQLRIMKTHFYAFSVYLVGVFSVWVREMIVYILARVREHFFIIDFWSGICILVLAIAGFALLLGKNMYVKSWWSINVETSQTDLSVINARVYKFDEKGDLKSPDSPYKPTVTSL